MFIIAFFFHSLWEMYNIHKLPGFIKCFLIAYNKNLNYRKKQERGSNHRYPIISRKISRGLREIAKLRIVCIAREENLHFKQCE